MRDTARTTSIQRLGYLPKAAAYRFDIEAFTLADLRLRGSEEKVRTTHRYEFHMLVCVTRGACTQMVDFRPVQCAPGSLLMLKPGQAHNFGRDEDWEGWIVLFRPEAVMPTAAVARDLKLAVELERLPEHLDLEGDALRVVVASMQQMRDDARLDAPPAEAQALLRHQLLALLTRLRILQGRQPARVSASSGAMQRFKRFQLLVEERFHEWHQLPDYADRLGCSEKSLGRAVLASAGTTAKAFIAARITLEAKRLLVHTAMPVAAIGGKLGFDEPTNFGKFFRREAGCSPAQFRRGDSAVPGP